MELLDFTNVITLMKLGENFKKIRLAKGLTQSDVAEKAGISSNYISRLESGEFENARRQTVESLATALGNVNLITNTLDLYPDQTKTASRGFIPIHKLLVPIFKELIGKKKKSDWLFSGKNGHQVEYKKALQRACARASKKHGKKIYITAYQLRHTFATRVLDKTNDLRTVQQLLRHTNISMTTRYATSLETKLRDAVNRLS